MFSTVLPVWGVALLLSVSCWSIGARLVTSRSPLVRLLGGWCVFLLLCALTWIAGLSAHAVRPAFWLFFLVGAGLALRDRRWPELAAAAVCTGVVAGLLGFPFLRFPGLLTYGAHGTDMWGYIITADWLQDHSFRQLPDIGVSPMRFNWTYHVLDVRDRPLNYQSLACLAAATGLTPAKAYLAYPVTLLASLAMGLSREPGLFRLKPWGLALLPALATAFHPLIVLPWIAGFFGGTIAALCTALAFAGAAVADEEGSRGETLALAVLMMVFCGGLYTLKFLYVGLALGGAPLLLAAASWCRPRNWHRWRGARPGPRMLGLLAAIALLTAALLVLGRDQRPDIGPRQLPVAASAHLLGIFGGQSPYGWLGYGPEEAGVRDPLHNPTGIVALGVLTALFTLVSWARWRANRDIRIPLLLGLAAGALAQTVGDELIMAKTLAIFGTAGLIVLAAVSSELRHRWLGLVALGLCGLPALRSAAEMQDLIYGPYITCTEENLAAAQDGQDWRVLGYLHFREDRDGFDWAQHPRTYFAVTQFLPLPLRERLAEKYHLPKP